MGTYAYTLMKATIAVNIDGKIEQVGRMKYAGKPARSSMFSEPTRSDQILNVKLNRAQRTWKDGVVPALFVYCDDNGHIDKDAIILENPNRAPSIFDDNHYTQVARVTDVTSPRKAVAVAI